MDMINGYPRGRSDRKLFPEQASPTRVTSLMVLVEGDDNFRSPPPRAPRSLSGNFFGTAGSYYDLTVAMVSIVCINVIYPSSKWTEMGGHQRGARSKQPSG
jgi:hypothetical protein